VTRKEQHRANHLLVQLTLKENKMNKLIATLIASAFAVSAFAAEPAKTEVKPAPAVTAAPAPHKVEAKKEAKPAKSVPAKDEKAAVPATKPASK
jgi:hypothetical protein